MSRTLVISGQPTVPSANGETMCLDSTRRLIQTVGTGSARLATGNYRNAWAGGRVRGSIKNGDQDITVNLLLLTTPTGTTNTAWEVDATAESAGAITVSANTTKIIDWLPRTPDFAVEAAMGATATSAITTTFTIEFDPSPSV